MGVGSVSKPSRAETSRAESQSRDFVSMPNDKGKAGRITYREEFANGRVLNSLSE